MDVDDVELALAELATRRNDPAGGEWREVGDRTVGREPGGPAERHQVVGEVIRFRRRRTMEHPADPVRGVDGGENTNVVAPPEKLLGECLHVPVHASLVGPGIWRDESNSHGG